MVDYKKFKVEFVKATGEFFVAAREEFGETLQIIGIYTNDELSYFYPTCQYGNSRNILEELKNETLSPADWNGHEYQRSLFSKLETVIAKGWNTDFSRFDVDRFKISEILIESTRIIRQQYFENSNVICGIFCAGNQHLFYDTAPKINPKNVIEMYTN